MRRCWVCALALHSGGQGRAHPLRTWVSDSSPVAQNDKGLAGCARNEILHFVQDDMVKKVCESKTQRGDVVILRLRLRMTKASGFARGEICGFLAPPIPAQDDRGERMGGVHT